MEARIARLEADVAHLRTDVADIKVDLRALRDGVDARMERFETLKDGVHAGDESLRNGIAALQRDTAQDAASLRDSIAALRQDTTKDAANLRESIAALRQDTAKGASSLREEIASAKVWALLLYVALAAGMLGTMARGFGWV
jgi:predicted  nucleic acid-binding Zn-ribbon protein